MKQEIKTTEAIFPMPVLMISTFNEDGSVDAEGLLKKYLTPELWEILNM